MNLRLSALSLLIFVNLGALSCGARPFHSGDDPTRLPKDSKVTVSTTDPNDGTQIDAKATIHWHWAFEGAANGSDPSTGFFPPGTMVTMAPVRDDSLTSHQPAPKPIEQIQPGDRILLPGKSTLPRLVISKETLPDGTIILHLGTSPEDNPDDPAFSDMEQANRVHDAALDAQYTGAKHVKTGLETYKAVAEFYAYGPFYNLGGAVLGTFGSKAAELFALAVKEEKFAAEAGSLAGKARAVATKLRQAIGQTQSADEIAVLTQKAKQAEKEATQLEAGAAEAQSVATQSNKVSRETQEAVTFAQQGTNRFNSNDVALGIHENLTGFRGNAKIGSEFPTPNGLWQGITDGIDAVVNAGGHIHFNLDGIKVNEVLNATSANYNTYTSRELRYVLENYREFTTIYKNGVVVPFPF